MLSPKHEAFCMHYAKTGNATEAYKQAGYNPRNDNSAGANARRLLQNDKIKQRLSEISAEIASEKIASVREIQERLTAILRGEFTEDQTVIEGLGDGLSQARNMPRAPLAKDIIRAAEVLARMQGAFDNKVHLNIAVPVFEGEKDLED